MKRICQRACQFEGDILSVLEYYLAIAKFFTYPQFGFAWLIICSNNAKSCCCLPCCLDLQVSNWCQSPYCWVYRLMKWMASIWTLFNRCSRQVNNGSHLDQNQIFSQQQQFVYLSWQYRYRQRHACQLWLLLCGCNNGRFRPVSVGSEAQKEEIKWLDRTLWANRYIFFSSGHKTAGHVEASNSVDITHL